MSKEHNLVLNARGELRQATGYWDPEKQQWITFVLGKNAIPDLGDILGHSAVYDKDGKLLGVDALEWSSEGGFYPIPWTSYLDSVNNANFAKEVAPQVFKQIKKKQNGGNMNYSQYLAGGGLLQQAKQALQLGMTKEQVVEQLLQQGDEGVQTIKEWAQEDPEIVEIANQLVKKSLGAALTYKCGGSMKKHTKIRKAACGTQTKKASKKEDGGEIDLDKCGGKAKKKIKKAENGCPVCAKKLMRVGGKIVEVMDCGGVSYNKSGGDILYAGLGTWLRNKWDDITGKTREGWETTKGVRDLLALDLEKTKREYENYKKEHPQTMSLMVDPEGYTTKKLPSFDERLQQPTPNANTGSNYNLQSAVNDKMYTEEQRLEARDYAANLERSLPLNGTVQNEEGSESPNTNTFSYWLSQNAPQYQGFSARKTIASQYGIQNYTGTPEQNAELWNKMKTQREVEQKPMTITHNGEERQVNPRMIGVGAERIAPQVVLPTQRIYALGTQATTDLSAMTQAQDPVVLAARRAALAYGNKAGISPTPYKKLGGTVRLTQYLK